MHSEHQNELEEKIGAGSKNTDDIFDLAEIYFYKGMFVQMLNLLETLDDIPLRENDQVHLCQQKAEALRSLGRFEDFEYQYKKSLEIPVIPEDTFEYFFAIGRSHYNLACYLKETDEVSKYSNAAIEFLSKSLTFNLTGELAKGRSFINSWIGDAYSRIGRFEEALRAHGNALQISTELQDLVGIWTDIGSVHLLSGNFEEAEKSYKKAISMACERVPVAQVYSEMGRMYVEWRKFPDAVHAFKNAHSQLAFDVRLKNSVGYETNIIWYIGYSAFQSGYGDETIAYMTKVLEESHEGDAWYAETHLILAHQYNKNGDTSKAREHYGRVIMDPNAGPQRVRIAEEYLAALPLDS